MLESSVELLEILSLIVLPVLLAFCIVGSIVAALTALSGERTTVNKRS
jgi:hypothetical protein